MRMAPLEKALLLEDVELFSSMPAAALAHLARCAQVVSFETGEAMARRGDSDDRLYVLVCGDAVVTHQGEFVGKLPRRECFGELALFAREPHTLSIEARSPVVCLSITRRDLYAALRKKPEAALDMLEELTRKLRAKLQLPFMLDAV